MPVKAENLPPLPEPLTWKWHNTETGGSGFHPIRGHGNQVWAHLYTWEPVFTRDQMYAYGAACIKNKHLKETNAS